MLLHNIVVVVVFIVQEIAYLNIVLFESWLLFFFFAELDVLISLSIASDYYEGRSCRPVIASLNPDEEPFLKAKSLGHPILRSDTLGEGTFVTNDVILGGSDHSSFILLTGPNMGGKSTLLRQVCLAVILAQVWRWISFPK